MTQKRLENRVAIVTGGAQGIGAAYAKGLADAGAKVCVCDVLDSKSIVRQITATGGEAISVHCDVVDPQSVRTMVATTLDAYGRIDILLNNAGIFASLALKSLTEIDSAEFDKVMMVNVRGSFECIKAVVPAMRERRYGKIINIASATVFKGSPMLLHYVASKGAVIALTRAAARELGEDGICVNSIAPGFTMSEGVLANPAWTSAAAANSVASRAIKREALPEDLVGTAVYLSSNDSDFMTGQVLVVDGGSIMH